MIPLAEVKAIAGLIALVIAVDSVALVVMIVRAL